MKRVRIIPILLMQRDGLVKSVKFKNHTYVGDPINAVKIFNEKEVDEMVLLDISATAEKRGPDLKRVREIATEAFMPIGYGGGVTKLDEIKDLISGGVEKVILNTIAFTNPQLVTEGSTYAGSQSITVSVDVKKNIFGKYRVYVQNGLKNTDLSPLEFAKRMENAGAGELLVNSIDRDGTFGGYDIELVELVSKAVKIPVVAVGGAGSLDDFKQAVLCGASAVAAGSLFVFQRPHRAVLISYPSQKDLKEQVFSWI